MPVQRKRPYHALGKIRCKWGRDLAVAALVAAVLLFLPATVRQQSYTFEIPPGCFDHRGALKPLKPGQTGSVICPKGDALPMPGLVRQGLALAIDAFLPTILLGSLPPVGVLLTVCYFFYLTKRGNTPGRNLMNMRLCKVQLADDGSKAVGVLGMKSIALEALLLSPVATCISGGWNYFWAIFDRNRQTLLYKLLGVYMVSGNVTGNIGLGDVLDTDTQTKVASAQKTVADTIQGAQETATSASKTGAEAFETAKEHAKPALDKAKGVAAAAAEQAKPVCDKAKNAAVEGLNKGADAINAALDSSDATNSNVGT